MSMVNSCKIETVAKVNNFAAEVSSCVKNIHFQIESLLSSEQSVRDGSGREALFAAQERLIQWEANTKKAVFREFGLTNVKT